MDEQTFAAMVLARADDDHPALLFEDRSWSWRGYVAEVGRRANWLDGLGSTDRPRHVAVLLENVPEFPFLLGACAITGSVLIGVNPTRRGIELARDLAHTRADILVTERAFSDVLTGVELPIADEFVFDVDTGAWSDMLEAHATAPPIHDVDPDAPFLLIFTSGTTGDPKAAQVSQRRLASTAREAATGMGLTHPKVCYVAMPLFHSNSLFAGWGPAVAGGAACALRRRFSASGFLPDVRRFGATYFNYVGKPLSYILATDEQPDDAENPLELVLGNEGALHDVRRFAERFGCYVVDNYGSTEGGIIIIRTPETPDGALGVPKGDGVVVLDPATGRECATAEFDDAGRLSNGDEAVGEIASRVAADSFEGYWDNEEADHERVRDGIYWSGDLGYRDADGFLWFAGRSDDWLRVDGENFAAAPVERILSRHPAIALVAVYAVPNEHVGDDVMTAVVMVEGSASDMPGDLGGFLDDQADLHAKARPRFVRVASELPMTPTNKVLKRVLRREQWACEDPIWIRDGDGYRPLDDDDRTDLRARFAARRRDQLLPERPTHTEGTPRGAEGVKLTGSDS